MIIKQQKLEFNLTKLYNIKENKYFLYSDKNQTFLFEFNQKDQNEFFTKKQSAEFDNDNNNTNTSKGYLNNKIYTSIKELKISLFSEEINSDEKDKEKKERKKSFSSFGHTDKDPFINFHYENFHISLKKSNFQIENLFPTNENEDLPKDNDPQNFSAKKNYEENLHINSLYGFSNEFTTSHFANFEEDDNYIFHHKSNQLNISFYNQFEEINLNATFQSESKFSILFMNKFISNVEDKEKDIKIGDFLLFVIFKDLSVNVFKYNKVISQLEKVHKMFLMIKDEYMNMKYLIVENLLIGYLEELIFIFDLHKIKYKKEEKFVDFTIELNNLFLRENEPLHFTNYFKDNFKEKYNYYMDSIMCKSFMSQDYIPKKRKFSTDINLAKKKSKTFNITASTILTDPDNKSIYYIFGTDSGNICMIDIFFDENLHLNPIFVMNYHTAKINFMMIMEQKYLISASDDGVISITDICKKTIENAIERYKSESFNENVDLFRKDSIGTKNSNSFDEGNEYDVTRKRSNASGKQKLNKQDSFNENISHHYNKHINLNIHKNNNPSAKLMTNKIYSFNSFFKRRKSIDEENKANIIIDKILDIHENDEIKKNPENQNFIKFLPIFTMKYYYKLKKILPVNFVDVDNINAEKQKFYIGIVLEDNSALIINTETMKIIYIFNINFTKKDIKGIYLKYSHKILMFFMEDATLKICNYVNKMGDREISDIESIYSLLRVDEKLKGMFNDLALENFVKENFHYIFDSEEYRKYLDQHKKSDNNNTNTNNAKKQSNFEYGKIIPGKGNDYDYSNNANSNANNNKKSSNNANKGDKLNLISIEFILGALDNEVEKTIFLQDFIFNLFSYRKLEINISSNKFESYLIKKAEGFILDKIFDIINTIAIPEKENPKTIQNNKNDNINNPSAKKIFSKFKNLSTNNFEIAKKLEIFNLINNPNKFTKLTEKGNLKTQGIDTNLILLGSQTMEFIDFQLEEFIQFLERKVEKFKNSQNLLSTKINYLNLISIFRIWNLSVENDLNFYNYLKIFQPIFDFSIILKGENSTLTIPLAEESEIDGFLNKHFDFFKEYLNSSEDKKGIFKDGKYFDKRYLISYQKGYLVNFKNHNISPYVSHLVNLAYFSSFVSILGFQECNLINKLFNSEKNLLRTLSLKKFIGYSNLFITNRFFFQENDDVYLANKDVILFDYLFIKGNAVMLNHLKDVLFYLIAKFDYLFKDEFDALNNFYKLNKEKNIEQRKINLIDQYDMFLINLIITYDGIFPNTFKSEEMIKIIQIMVLLIFKILKDEEVKSKYSKIIVEMLSKSIENLRIIYKENMFNYGKFLIELYTSIKVPIDLDGSFKKYDLDTCTIIKSDSKLNFLKIMLAKQIKYFTKLKTNTMIFLITEEFKKKNKEFNYFTHLLEILWLLLREKNAKYVQYLPSIVNLLVTNISPQNKEMKNVCMEYSKKILACLISYYPMVSIDTQTVGANDGKIYIYDLSSGSFWKNLNAHQSEISALIFDNTGNIIISYSSTELTIGLANFLSTLFTSKNGYYQMKNLEPLEQSYDEKEKIETVKFQSMQKGDNKILLIREDKSNIFMKI